MELPAGIAAQAAITQQNVALSVIKQAAQADRQIANILENAIQNVPTSRLGSNVNFSA
jgi:hypothetical protein